MDLIDLTETKLSPPVVHVAMQLDELQELAKSAQVNARLRKVYEALIELKQNGSLVGDYCSFDQVCHIIGRASGTVRTIFKDAVKEGLVKETGCQVTEGQAKRSSLFVLVSPAELETNDLSVISASNELRITEELDYGITDDLVCYLLFSGLEYNLKSKNKTKNVTLYLDNAPLHVNVRTAGNYPIARIHDIKYYVGLLALVERVVEQRIKAAQHDPYLLSDVKSTLFEMYESDILKAMGKGKKGKGIGSGERDSLNKALFRLSGTEYFIEYADSKTIDKLGLHHYELNILHFKIKEYTHTKDNRVVYRFEFEQRLINRMAKYLSADIKRYSRVNFNLIQETNPLKIAFLVWASHQQPGGGTGYTWEQLKDRIAPTESLKIFKQKFSVILRDAVTRSDTNKKVNQEFIDSGELDRVLEPNWTTNIELDEDGSINKCESKFDNIIVQYQKKDDFYIVNTDIEYVLRIGS